MPLFLQRVLTERLCARHCSRCWGHIRELDKNPWPLVAFILVEEGI